MTDARIEQTDASTTFDDVALRVNATRRTAVQAGDELPVRSIFA